MVDLELRRKSLHYICRDTLPCCYFVLSYLSEICKELQEKVGSLWSDKSQNIISTFVLKVYQRYWKQSQNKIWAWQEHKLLHSERFHGIIHFVITRWHILVLFIYLFIPLCPLKASQPFEMFLLFIFFRFQKLMLCILLKHTQWDKYPINRRQALCKKWLSSALCSLHPFL